MCVPFKRQLSNARVPLRAYPTSFSYPVMIYTQRERERERKREKERERERERKREIKTTTKTLRICPKP